MDQSRFRGWCTCFECLGCLTVVSGQFITHRKVADSLSKRLSYFLATIILLLSAGFRFTGLVSLPPGLRDEEINEIRLATTIRVQGQIEVFYNVAGEGKEGLYHIVQALLTSIVGNGTLGYRMLPIWMGMLLLAIVYALGSRLYGRVAGLSAMALLSVMMWSILLSRQVVVEAIIPTLFAAVLLALAWALPVYRRVRAGITNTTSFAILGFLLGISLYVHPGSLLIILITMSFIAYLLLAKQPFLSRRHLSYIGFTILVMIIVAVPYLISSINRPDLAVAGRTFGEYQGILSSLGNTLSGIFFIGDLNPAVNLPDRPLIDLVSGLFVLIGVLISLRFWSQPRFTLVLISTVFLLPVMIVAKETPNFMTYAGLLPIIALFFGAGVQIVWQSVAKQWRWVLALGLFILYGFNIYWMCNDLFVDWRNLEAMQTIYHAPQGELARYVDRTADEIPTVLCVQDWDQPPQPPIELNNTRLMLLMMNRPPAILRRVDCRNGLVFANGGALTQLIMPESNTLENTHEHLKNWLEQGDIITESNIPEDSVYLFQIDDILADTAGMFILTSPVRFASEIDGEMSDIETQPPIRFGGNITFLGYVPASKVTDGDDPPTVISGDTISVISYWRIEGEVPRDLTLFTHVLSDPVTIAANRDYISADPRHLRERDVIIQVTNVQLPDNLLEGEYMISTGAYQGIDKTRLVVLQDEQPHGDRLFLYPIMIEAPIETEETN